MKTITSYAHITDPRVRAVTNAICKAIPDDVENGVVLVSLVAAIAHSIAQATRSKRVRLQELMGGVVGGDARAMAALLHFTHVEFEILEGPEAVQ